MSQLRRYVAIALTVMAGILGPARLAQAADVHPIVYSEQRGLVIEGPIEAGDFDTFVKIVRENRGLIQTVFLFSPGGDFDEAMRIGRAMRALNLSSLVPARSPSGQPECDGVVMGAKPADPRNCTAASAAFFIHIGATSRSGAYLAVQRPYIDRKRFSQMPRALAEQRFNALQAHARQYMTEMGVPEAVQAQVMNTPSEEIRVLDDDTIRTYFAGDTLAFQHEAIQSKCKSLTAAEQARLQGYRERSMRSNAPRGGLSVIEFKDFGELQERDDKELRCGAEIERAATLAAYEKYFGVPPTDYEFEDFGKWPWAAHYLGKAYYEIQGEEPFVARPLLPITALVKKRTATTPEILILDDPAKRQVAVDVTIDSDRNPSPEFRRRLVAALEKAWGPPNGRTGTTDLAWTRPTFTAVLHRYEGSADGPYLTLAMHAR